MTIGALYNANNVVVGQAAVFTGVKDLALPALTAWNEADPFDAAFFTTPTGWTPVGATDQGWSFGAEKQTQTINIEEQSTPVATTLTSQAVTISGALSEDISKTLLLALNATKTTTAPSTGNAGYDLVTLTDTPLVYAVAMVTVNAAGYGRLIYAPQWTQLENANVAFRRAADKRNYGVQFSTVCATNLIKIYEFNVAPS